MGVTGLWRLIEPSGKPVPLETLENKVLAVDVSIWLHQAIKGFQDAQGGPLPNAHLLGIYHRVCKLLYFRVKPIFVFDGGVPNLKKETIAKRYQQKSKKLSEAEVIQKQLLTTLLKHSAVSKVLSEKAKATLATKPNLSKLASKQNSEDNIYKLPPTDFDSTLSSEDETSESVDSSPTKHWDLHTVDEKSEHFKSLPADVRHEILTELKETRKQSSWGRLHELPKQSDDFSGFQMKRLLKRYSVQVSLEEAEKEMGGRSLSLAELESLLKDQGVDTSSNTLGRHIASDENTRYLLIKDVKTAMVEASKRKSPILGSITEEDESKKEDSELKCIGEPKEQTQSSTVRSVETCDSNVQTDDTEKVTNIPDSEFQRDLEKAIQLSLQDIPSTSKESSSVSSKKHNFSFLQDFDDADFKSSSESEDDSCQPKNMNKILASAKSYMVEYSGLTPSEIAKIIGNNVKPSNKIETNGVSKISSPENLNIKSVSTVIESNRVDSSTSNKEYTKILEKQKVTSDENDDGTVSSSTTETLQPVETSVSLDTNQVISSTTKDDTVSEASNKVLTYDTEVKENNESDNELIEVMSTASSNSSVDFQEICEEDKKGKDSKEFEILIKPDDTLEDDIFSDIFCDTKDNNSISTSRIDNTIIAQSQQNKPVIETPEIFMEQVTTSDSSSKMMKLSDNKLTKESASASSTAEDVTDKEKDREQTSAHSELTENILQSVTESSNKPDSNPHVQELEKQALTSDQLKEIEQNLILEEAELVSERLSKERMANSLTDQIYQEAQELLQLFGVPYITAPMEAEAQCAFLDDISVTDGTITDDSDIWLFGGKTVYKNFFNQQKHVMEFRAESIQHHFKLSREQMILLALLVGSDYTVGIQGIGPVTALEVLAAFPPSKNLDQQLVSGLAEFRKWLAGERTMGPGRTTLRNKLKNVTLSESFPSLQVVKAYLEPTVDTSKEPFSWAKPDMQGLIEFARKKFGWAQVKSEEILKPVFKRLDETRIQRTIKDYFQTKHKIDSGEAEKKMSKRVKRAVDKIDKGEPHSSDESKEKTKPQKRRKKANAGCEQNKNDAEGSVKAKQPQKRNTKDKSKAVTETITTVEASISETAGLSSDEDIQVLKKAHTESKQKLKQIRTEIKNEMESTVIKKPITIASLHKKEIIPQREQEKVNVLRSKMKAIEVFRKSKRGPGYVKKRKVGVRPLKEDAELSESGSD